MEIWDIVVASFSFLLDFVLHIDEHLYAFVSQYGNWVYALLFLIIFVETGVVVMPFLPGDSLLFVVGAMAGAGMIDLPLAMGLMFTAAFLGDQCNYTIGHWLGPRVFKWENSRFFNRKAFDAAHRFYEKHGGITVIVARFMPFIRTFVPFVAGVAHMTRSRFVFFNLIGAMIWVVGVTSIGYWFGGHEMIQRHFEKVIWALIIIPGLIALIGGWRAGRHKHDAPTSS
ncbi:putative membrane protein [Saezia sanguinis]|jgi:membrane-associated protein|uniref:Putative membrane protein n=1 Tax=Saezia sanguinis TaxID=1965230 RepID=A0A433SFY3_9BURK|nr:VTT domain-containing protein [Saezia sanguinis]RUS67620.1 putative membrane protein [Saezia sanguinis]